MFVNTVVCFYFTPILSVPDFCDFFFFILIVYSLHANAAVLCQTPVVDSGTELARSLPKSVPESPCTSQSRTPRTPRTPGRQDPNKTPRFYPVMKESSTIDGQVRQL